MTSQKRLLRTIILFSTPAVGVAIEVAYEHHMMLAVKSVAVVGCGPAGAITIDALVQEGVFEKITVFERREKAGGCWFVIHGDQLTQLRNLQDP